MFVMDNLLNPFNVAKGDKQKILVIQDAIAMSISDTAESSEIEKKNKEELRNFIIEGLTSYYQKMLPRIREAFSNHDFSDSKAEFSDNVNLESERQSLLKRDSGD